MRSLATFEQMYLQRSANRLNEAVAQSVAGGARAPPAMGEGISIARTAANELDAAKFDPMLVKAVARNVQSCLEMLLNRLDPLVSCCLHYYYCFVFALISELRSCVIGGRLACWGP